jgi:uncharacterized protein involved in exopolysaccharide biosynthesis
MDDSTPIIDVTPHASGFVPADDVWAFLRRRKGAIAFFWVVGLVAALWWLLSWPNLYQAESRVMIVRTGGGGPVSEAELASEIELVRDPSHIQRTASRQFVNPSDAQVHQAQRKIDAALSVGPAGKSNLVAIQYRDTDPNAAALITNQIVDLYLAERRFIFQLNGQSPNRPSTDSLSPAAAADLLAAFDLINHGPELKGELQARVQHRIELESRLADLKAQIRDQQESANSLRRRRSSVPERVQSRTRTRTSPNPSSRLVEETEILNPLKQQIDSELVRIDSTVAGLNARLEQTVLSLREARAAEERVSTLSSERDRLERRLLDARGTPDASAAGPNDRPNLRATLVNRAEPPYGPLPRYMWIWIPVAVFAALAVAVILAWLFDQFDKPIYTPDDFERASGVPPMDDHFAEGAGA